ncbi:OadG family transporter subunit [uncultured Gilvimarinus sp.]|uniref:OadG family protein n=1 Tax=uncultured Gilvimarinus sp. TaxID=1689143 RepID=UPI0030EBD716|tara:strand:- start:106 stop:354 length:249 start_codon:yes stop_codon:yes gene_type:complete
MQDTLMQQGMDLMIYGMGTVLVFLTLLVIATLIMSKLVMRFFPDPVIAETPRPSRQVAAETGVDPAVRSAIEKAIKLHRARH